MSRVLAVDANNDLYIGPDGAMVTADGLTAVMQAAQQAAQTMLGEMIYAVDEGLPNFDVIWNGSPNVAQFEAALRRALLAVDNVTGMPSISTAIAAGTLSYRATIQTIYGPGVLNG